MECEWLRFLQNPGVFGVISFAEEGDDLCVYQHAGFVDDGDVRLHPLGFGCSARYFDWFW